MRISIFLSICCICFSSAYAGNIVCYFTSWTQYRMGNGMFDTTYIDPNLCTHIIYAFVGLDETNGQVVILDSWEAVDLGALKNLTDLKSENPSLKVLVGMGGYNEGSIKYSKIASDPRLRANNVQSVLKFLRTWDYDGFDLDWEYPGQLGGNEEIDKENYVLWLSELKAALNADGKILSAAVSGGVNSVDISYNIKEVSNNLDMINVMAYDYHGSWENFVGHSAPLYPSHLDQTSEQIVLNVDSGIQHWIEGGAERSKINLGIGTYGRGFTLADSSNTSLYAPAFGPSNVGPYTQESGSLGYNEICEFHQNATYVFDNEQKVPHRSWGNQWVGYDDFESLKIKINYANELGLGGMMVWSLDTDDFRGICGEGKYPLLRTINENLI